MPGGTDEPITEADISNLIKQGETALGIIAVHWIPDGQPWTAKCKMCRDGSCLRFKWATGFIASLKPGEMRRDGTL